LASEDKLFFRIAAYHTANHDFVVIITLHEPDLSSAIDVHGTHKCLKEKKKGDGLTWMSVMAHGPLRFFLLKGEW
jgi:hypothetical protein